MPKYKVNVHRTVDEEVVVFVEAEDKYAAIDAAKQEATNIDLEEWSFYNCEYWADEREDVEEVS